MADTTLRRGDRIGLLGPNGAGKTTLLRTLVGQIPVLEGAARLGHNVQIGYYAQTHEDLRLEGTLLDEIRHASHLSEEGARSYLGRFLFSGDDVFKPVGSLCGGERSRVALAKLTLQGANFLVLDEPTNHLDLPARQVLEEILVQYDGTLIFVSHDRYFVDALATRLWVLHGGAVEFVGNYTRSGCAPNTGGTASPRPWRRCACEQAERRRAEVVHQARERGAGSIRTALDVEAEIAGAEPIDATWKRPAPRPTFSDQRARGRVSAAAALLAVLYDEWQDWRS